MKSTVAAISFLDSHSLSLDVEGVNHIEMGPPISLDEGMWTSTLFIRSANGTVALQLVANSLASLRVSMVGGDD